MDIDSFIAKYGPEWKRLEAAIAHGSRGLTQLPGPEIRDVVRLYLRASAHLAEARSRYGDERLHTYLNGIVGRAHSAIYSGRTATTRGLVQLFGARYRAAIRRTVPFILVAAGLLVLVTVASFLWVASSREAQAGLLPPAAHEAIRRATGHRPNVGLGPAAVSTFILTNNIQVSILAFALGITFGVGTIYIVVQNALLLGVLAGAFQAGGKAGPFWSLILPHGLLELTAVCIAAGAGLRVGWSLIAPGDRARTTALTEETRDAILVVVGVVPAFVVAAAIEGFVTGSVPGWLGIGLGIVVDLAYLAFLFGAAIYKRPKALMRRY